MSERDVANDLIGLYDATRAAASAILAAYTFTPVDPDYDPAYAAHRGHLRALIDLCERASDALIVDYGG